MKINSKVVQYIRVSINERKRKVEQYIYSNTPVYIKDPLISDHISIESVIKKLKKILPSFFFQCFDYIYIGHFDEFLERDVNAMYKDGVVYVSNVQDDEEDMLDDIIHEICHGLEEMYPGDIYGDGTIEKEFFSKRKKLYYILKSRNYDISPTYFFDDKFNEEFDDFLYKEVGYPLLRTLTTGLFTDPYSITSLREYFAQGNVYYYLKNRIELNKTCPALFQKIEELRAISGE